MELVCEWQDVDQVSDVSQMKQLAEIDAGLQAEHKLRRHMLTERANVSLQKQLACVRTRIVLHTTCIV